MRILIAEDDLASRKYMYEILSKYGNCDIVVDGMEALEAFLMALDENEPYDLICLDIMMPKVDGLKALKGIRDIEKQKMIEDNMRVKIIMTTALTDVNDVRGAFEMGCEAYAAKPIDVEKIKEVIRNFGLIK